MSLKTADSKEEFEKICKHCKNRLKHIVGRCEPRLKERVGILQDEMPDVEYSCKDYELGAWDPDNN